MTRMTNADLGERMAAMEATLTEMRAHIATREQMGKVETRLGHIEERMPELSGNTKRADKGEGWHDAKEDTERDMHSIMAVGVSFVALIISGVAALWDMIGGPGQ